ncbi:hypothetical protein Slin14017_G066600 [Septoria linicola]|nr:hypothetical protein Slin14017_G066600 [Septoria linicola]
MFINQVLLALLPIVGSLANPNSSPKKQGCQNGAITLYGRRCYRFCGHEFTSGSYKNDYQLCFNDCVEACAKDSNCNSAKWSKSSKKCYYNSNSSPYWQETGRGDGIKCGKKPKPKTTTKCTTTIKTTTSATTTKCTTHNAEHYPWHYSVDNPIDYSINNPKYYSFNHPFNDSVYHAIYHTFYHSVNDTFHNTFYNHVRMPNAEHRHCIEAVPDTGSIIPNPGVGGITDRAVLTPFEKCQQDCDGMDACVGLNSGNVGGIVGCTLFSEIDGYFAAPGDIAAIVTSTIDEQATITITITATETD